MLPIKASHAEKHFTPRAQCSSEEGGFVCVLLIVFTSNFSRSGFWGDFFSHIFYFFLKFSSIWKPLVSKRSGAESQNTTLAFHKRKKTKQTKSFTSLLSKCDVFCFLVYQCLMSYFVLCLEPKQKSCNVSGFIFDITSVMIVFLHTSPPFPPHLILKVTQWE